MFVCPFVSLSTYLTSSKTKNESMKIGITTTWNQTNQNSFNCSWILSCSNCCYLHIYMHMYTYLYTYTQMFWLSDWRWTVNWLDSWMYFGVSRLELWRSDSVWTFWPRPLQQFCCCCIAATILKLKQLENV